MTDAAPSQAELLSALSAPLAADSARVPVAAVAGLQLYPNLGLFPRWPGFEEDEELAGPETGASTPSAAGGSDYESLAPKQLGRLKAQGVDVSGLMQRKRRKGKGGVEVAVGGEERALNADA